MNGRIALLLVALLVSGCVQRPQIDQPERQALLRTRGEFTQVDGAAPQSPYQLLLEAGSHRVEVRYRTLRENYYCLFEFDARAGQHYEIIVQSNPHPLRLYRLKRQNALWGSRLDPVNPQHCEVR